MCVDENNYKTICINKYNELLNKLFEKELLDLNGNQFSSDNYCINNSLIIEETNKYIKYSGRIIQALRCLTDYEIVMLVNRGNVISYDITRDYTGQFKVLLYKSERG